jgi:hypothetical protein
MVPATIDVEIYWQEGLRLEYGGTLAQERTCRLQHVNEERYTRKDRVNCRRLTMWVPSLARALSTFRQPSRADDCEACEDCGMLQAWDDDHAELYRSELYKQAV